MNMRKKFLLVAISTFLCLLVLVLFIIRSSTVTAPKTTTASEPQTARTLPRGTTPDTFDSSLHSIDQPGSPWWIVNKNRPLPAGYIPGDLAVPNVSLRLTASSEQMKLSASIIPSVESFFGAADAAGVPLTFASGYRSEVYQTQLYNGYVARDGQAAADRYSAKPGTSEHQTGLAFDICVRGSACELTTDFASTQAGKWVVEHAHEHGLIIHYLQGKESFTGYDHEPWHLRFVGKELASELKKNGQALEEFLLD